LSRHGVASSGCADHDVPGLRASTGESREDPVNDAEPPQATARFP
jgi:hypothetical protein